MRESSANTLFFADVLPHEQRIRHKLPPLRALTSIRFFAAIHVVLFHEGVQSALTRFPLAAHFISSGFTGVTLFFVLSGFILAYNYRQVASPRSFFIARFARIYPIYLLALLSTMLLSLVHIGEVTSNIFVGFLLSLPLLQAWFYSYALLVNVPAWTLSVEAFFYVVFPFVLPWLSRPRRTLVVVLAVAWVLITAAPFLTHGIPLLAVSSLRFAITLERTNPIARLPCFLLGAWAGARFLQAPRRRQPMLLSFSSAAALALLIWNPTPTLLPLRTSLLTLAYTGLLFALATVEWKLLTNRWMQIAGEISYGIYILQMPFFRAWRGLMERLHAHLLTLPIFSITGLIFTAWLTHHYIEMPARVAIRRFLTHQPVPTMPI